MLVSILYGLLSSKSWFSFWNCLLVSDSPREKKNGNDSVWWITVLKCIYIYTLEHLWLLISLALVVYSVVCIDKLHCLWLSFSLKFRFSSCLNVVYQLQTWAKIMCKMKYNMSSLFSLFQSITFLCNAIRVTPFIPLDYFCCLLNYSWLRKESVDNPLTASLSSYLACFAFCLAFVFTLKVCGIW